MLPILIRASRPAMIMSSFSRERRIPIQLPDSRRQTEGAGQPGFSAFLRPGISLPADPYGLPRT